MNRRSITLRAAIGFGLVAAVFVAGVQYRSPWIVGPLTAVFLALSALSKRALWSELVRMKGPAFIVRQAMFALVSSLIPVVLIYLLGLGFGALFTDHDAVQPFRRADLWYVGVVLAIAAAAALVVERMEGEGGPPFDDFDLDPEEALRLLLEAGQIDEQEIEVDESPVTARNFFALQMVRNAAATEEELRETEARLGFRLPAQLADLYRIADGGATEALVVPTVENPGVERSHWTQALPADYLNGLDEIVQPSPEDLYEIAENAPDPSTLWMIGNVDTEITALVPTDDGQVRVVVCDLAGRDPEHPIWFQSFDAFMRALRRIIE